MGTLLEITWKPILIRISNFAPETKAGYINAAMYGKKRKERKERASKMTRKKVKLSWIVNDSARRASLRKRRVGLLKKVSELATLCGVSAFVIIYSPDDREPAVWPSGPEVEAMLARFKSLPEIERCKKMVNQETYLKGRMVKVQQDIKRQHSRHTEMEVSNLMEHLYYHGRTLDQFCVTELHSMLWYAEQKRKDIKRRFEYFEQAPLSPGSLPLALVIRQDREAPALADPNMGDETGGRGSDHYHHEKTPPESGEMDQLFINMMNSSQNVAGSSSGGSRAEKAVQGNQLGLLGRGSYIDYFDGGADTVLGLQPYGCLNIDGSDMPPLLPPPPPQGSSYVFDISLGLPLYEGFGVQGTGGSEMGMARPQPPSGTETDISLQPQPYWDVGAGGGIAGTGSNVGPPNDPTQPWPIYFYP